jgi:methionine sulfoxide reductase heme-binding subunit
MTKVRRLLLKSSIWTLALIPLFRLGFGLWRQDSGLLGANPFQQVILDTGWWGLSFLTLTLALTPIRRITSWAWPVTISRLVGLWAFVFICFHFLSYAVLDQSLDVRAILKDIAKRPFILLGQSAFLILLALAITSTKAWMKRLKHHWKRLHRLIYVAAILGVLHFAWKEKVGFKAPRVAAFGIIVTLLLLARIPMRPKVRPVAP